MKFNGTSTGINNMKILFVLIAIAAVTYADDSLGEQNHGEEKVTKTTVGEVGAKCSGSHCSGNINVKGDWFLAKDGSLVPIFEPAPPAGGKVEVGAECNGSKCGGSVKVGVEWFKSEEGRLVAVPSTNNQYASELSCNAGHCIRKFQVSKNSQTLIQSGGSDPQETKEIVVDLFKARDGSLVGVSRTDITKSEIVGIECEGSKCNGNVNVRGDWFLAGDGVTLPVPQSTVAQAAGTVEVGAECNKYKCLGNYGIQIKWIEDANGNIIPEVVAQAATDGQVKIEAECNGSKCGSSIKLEVNWFVAPGGVIVITPKPAGTHISGGIECHGSKCSGNIGVGVDWFKDENNNVVPILAPIPRPTDDNSYGKNYTLPIDKFLSFLRSNFYSAEEDTLDSYKDVSVIPVIPNVPRLDDPKSYSTNEVASYTKKIVLEKGRRDPNRPVEIVVDSDCKGVQIKGLKCHKITVDLRFYRLPNGEIIPQVVGEEEIPENISVSQISPTTARFKVSIGGKVKCNGRKCKGHVNIGLGNRKRRDLDEGNIQEIYRATLTYYKKEGDNKPFDLIFEFPQSF